MLPENYLPVLVFTVVGLGFPTITFLISRYFRPTKRTRRKDSTYECGETPFGGAQIQFSFQYYMFAIIFVVFDVVTVFLMIWALSYDLLDPVTGLFVLVFISVLLVGLFHALRKEAKIWI
jgi:NADH-quinone oxidoreductase subunit A